MIYVLIDNNGLIVNRILLDSLENYDVPEGFSITEEGVNKYDISGTFINSVYTPPTYEEVPSVSGSVTVTPRQARLVLLNAGLLDQVESAVDQAGGSTRIAWEYATEINRNDPLIQSIGQSLGLTEQQIDDLFTQAATL